MNTLEQQNRFKDAPWFPKSAEAVLIGGAGGIGSWLTFFLARIGFRPHVCDFDTIEIHNLGGQLFRQKDVGMYKVEAIQKIAEDYSGTLVSTSTEPIRKHDTPKCIYTFSAFDNMQARKDLFAAWETLAVNWLSDKVGPEPIFIDGRLEFEQLQIFCVTPKNALNYSRFHLFGDEEVEDARCTMKQNSHMAAMIASFMTTFFTNHITNVYAGETLRDVPFYQEYVAPLNLTVTQ